MGTRIMPFSRSKPIRLFVSPWMIMGAAGILLLVVAAIAVHSYNREKRYMSEILVEKGSALIKSFEAGTRTGMRAMGWGGNQVQFLIEEMARQPDVLYIFITDTQGRILAHSDPEQIDTSMRDFPGITGEAPEDKAYWRLRDKDTDTQAFEVFRQFNPFAPRHSPRARHSNRGQPVQRSNLWCSPDNYPEKRQMIFIGFDQTHFTGARRADFLNAAIISSVLLLLGFAGFITLIISQNYVRTRRRLQDTSAIADEVVASLPAGLMVMDRAGKIVLENQAAETITGLSLSEIRGRRADTVLPENLAALVASEPESGRVAEQEMECWFAGKDPVPLSVSAAPVINDENQWIGSVVIFSNLSEIKALQQTVARTEKLAAIGGLAAGVAHEIRNPLSSVKGMATYFQNRFSDDPEARQAAEVMVSETNRLNRVISELLEFARPSGIQTKPENINALIGHSLRLVGQDADQNGVEIRLIKDSSLGPAQIDEDRFLQCLLNLYINAIQAMEDGGILRVESRPGKDGTIEVEISDTGAGISETDANRIFDPYFTTKATGTGLGLAIVHKIIENHGGQITVRSTPGKGTTFIITLPAAGDPESRKD